MTRSFSASVTLLAAILSKVMCSSVFEVTLLRLNNNRGVNQYGRCCSGARTTPPCTDECQTYLSVCLMHHIQVTLSNPKCTYGASKTVVIGGNNLLILEHNDTHTMKLPIDFTWPGRFTLLVEAWHETTSNVSRQDSGDLIIRSTISKILYPSTSWRKETTITPTTELQYKYRVTCSPFFYGTGCGVICRSRDDRFGHYTCDNNGTKLCKEGWNGTFCDQALCSDECLRNKGFCERPFECRCRLGWFGPDCDQCQRNTGCLNGICYEPYQCICKDGWAGFLCDIDINYCSKSEPCLHGGTCLSDLVGNYTCVCPERFAGPNCQHALCYNEYCQNGGLCETRNYIRECKCTENFYGDRCQHRKLNCEEVICYNDGSCLMGDNGGHCICNPNSTGFFCETKLDDCHSNPCKNGGTCVITSKGYKCECFQNYAGIHCSYKINPCHNFKCSNGGRCIIERGTVEPFCDCPARFSGDHCQISLDPCHDVTCLNGGTCGPSPMGNGFVCYCVNNYHGEFCEEKMDLCASFPCKNGAECKNYITSFLCICTPYFYGEFCEFQIMMSDELENTDAINDFNNVTDVINRQRPTVNSTNVLSYDWLTVIIIFLTVIYKLKTTCYT